MEVEAAVLSAVSVRAAFSVINLTLQLVAYLFPKQAVVEDGSSYHFIIAGAGSAGCVLARRLSDNSDYNVLLIEAGGDPTLEVMLPGLLAYNQHTHFDWNYTTENDHHAWQCYQNGVFQMARGHGLGGTSSINYMFYVRGSPHDYNRMASITNDSSWDWDHVLPYFKKSERLEDPNVLHSSYRMFHGTTGEMGVTTQPDLENIKYLDALNEIGHKTVLDTNGYDTLGFTFPMYTMSQGKRESTCYSFLSPVKDRKNLHVLKNTKVTKVLFDNKVATGVEVVTEDNKTMTFKAEIEVIVSAGTLNSPQILMLSGVGPKDHLQSLNITPIVDLPVGLNLQDHVVSFIIHQTDASNETLPPQNPFKYPLKLMNGFSALNKSQQYPDSQITLLVSPHNSKGLVQLFAYNYRFQEDISKTVSDANVGRDLLVAFVTHLYPTSRGRVLLRSSNPHDPPKIYLDMLEQEEDIDKLVSFVQDYLQIENSTYFKSVNAKRVDVTGDRCNAFPPGSQEYWRCYCLCMMHSVFHYSGTCPINTVLDSRLRVLGVDRLRVVDASVFPIIPGANTNAPVIMVAEKAADMIKRDHYLYKQSGKYCIDFFFTKICF